MRRVLRYFMVGFLFHMVISEAYYIWQMKQTDYCEESTDPKDLEHSQKQECIDEILRMPPPFYVSPRLYAYLRYKNIEYLGNR